MIALRTRLTERQASVERVGVRRVEQVGVAARPASAVRVRGRAQRRHRAGVPHLQQLHGPLDVGEPAAAELEVGVRVGAARQPLVVDARLDPADLHDVVVA